jgi:hypothetical protein
MDTHTPLEAVIIRVMQQRNAAEWLTPQIVADVRRLGRDESYDEINSALRSLIGRGVESNLPARPRGGSRRWLLAEAYQ